MRFRSFFEATDIFGFDAKRTPPETAAEDLLGRPINMFNIELMMELLSKKRIGPDLPTSNFVTEMIWGNGQGAVKVEVDTGYTLYVKKLGLDLQGNPVWATKRMLQLNRQGYGGLEDSVAQELYEYAEKAYNEPQVNAVEFKERDLENLVVHISNKIKRTARNIFIFEGIRRLPNDSYLIKMGLRGQGVEAPDHFRIEENLTQVHYDKETGVIHITNYNVASPVGKAHSWMIHPRDLDIYFFPNQDREEMSECLAVHMKYY
jgi:hypothetical protein